MKARIHVTWLRQPSLPYPIPANKDSVSGINLLWVRTTIKETVVCPKTLVLPAMLKNEFQDRRRSRKENYMYNYIDIHLRKHLIINCTPKIILLGNYWLSREIKLFDLQNPILRIAVCQIKKMSVARDLFAESIFTGIFRVDEVPQFRNGAAGFRSVLHTPVLVQHSILDS